MKAVIQRVSQASVTVDGKIVGEIARGFLVLLGVWVVASIVMRRRQAGAVQQEIEEADAG